MEVQWLLMLHAVGTLLVVVSLLCGHWPIFEGTPIERIHYFITVGAYEYLMRFVMVVFGSRGRNVFLSVEHYCCDRPNPILQMIYLAIIGVTYFFLVKSSFRYIPGYYVAVWHRYASMLAVGFGVLLFLLTSFSDPGTIKNENVSHYISAYPYDNILYMEKVCPTCKILKWFVNLGLLGRNTAKYATVVWPGLIITVDGWCISYYIICSLYEKQMSSWICLTWFHNCRIIALGRRTHGILWLFCFGECSPLPSLPIESGESNVVLGLVLASQMRERKVIYILTAHYGIENTFSNLAPHISQSLELLQWLLLSYNTQILIMVFLTVVSLLLAGFFGYHTHLCVTNTTTNETFKWQDYISWKTKLNEAKASAAALKASISSMNGEKEAPQRKWRMFCRKPAVQTEEVVKNNIYDRGIFRNLSEIVFPLSVRPSFSRTKEA
ncbi:hypothetical protein Taro_006147 [Colocasia esculenta]|uniref:Protein S-acyltransferase n=1 Tax=Colocasia esculenta TaxID=4460 RepID=A0A843TQB7_COLES|nr:hypothetical protein [Colocasia esculenta]